jgi:predicted amidophosphoribosyltransferase
MPAVDLDRLRPQPAGFGNCGVCAYRDVGSAAVCFACAARRIDRVGVGHCPTCDQRLPPGGICSNYWCRRPVEDRYFSFIYAIAMRSGQLEAAINAYKFRDRTGWASIFGRVLVGYLDESPDAFNSWDAIIPSPTFTGAGARRRWDHIDLILQRAGIEAAGRWPIVARHHHPIVKTADTPSLVGRTLADRREITATQLRAALAVPDPSAVRNRSFLVFDDVFTDGSTLREVARRLLEAGASEVAGIVLARQPWRS